MSQVRTKKRAGKFRRLPKGQNGGIELLLIQSVDNLGSQGEVVEVKRGYACNYLIPQGLATVATEHHKRMVDKHKEKLLEIERSRLTGLRDIASHISKLSLTIEANADDEGQLYGSVSAKDIVASLKQSDFTVTADQIKMEGVLKELGLYTVKVQLHAQVASDLKVWVVPTADEQA